MNPSDRPKLVAIEVHPDRLIATMPGTKFVACFFKGSDGSGIFQAPVTSDDEDNATDREEFERLAWEAARLKARELGWID